ncbi:MAG: Maf family protein [bacterium]
MHGFDFEPESFWRLLNWQSPLILASASPRRSAILRALGCPFQAIPSNVQEEPYRNWDGGRQLERNAVQKAFAVKSAHPHRAILAADTIVLLENQVLGKPIHREEARAMLQVLSARDHEVWTALCFFPEKSQQAKSARVMTRVTFRAISSAEMEAYLQTGEPLDKAGAYGIQGIGGLFVQAVQGCYFNVVGLPVSVLWELMATRE